LEYTAFLLQHVALAGVSNAIGQTCSHPFDLLKTRLQLEGIGTRHGGSPGLIGISRRIFREEGWGGFAKGWRASVLRELSYSGMRIGLYEPVKELLGGKDNRTTTLDIKIAAGVVSGATGASLCTPYDLMKVRFQSARDVEAYHALGTPHGELVRIYRKEGVRGLYRGCWPTTLRGATITCTQVPSYDHVKHTLLNYKWMSEGKPLHFVSSLIAGVVTVAVVNPIDVAKTRIMVATGRPMSFPATFMSIMRNEGPMAGYKGALSAWLRLAPHTTTTFMTLEYLRSVLGIRPI